MVACFLMSSRKLLKNSSVLDLLGLMSNFPLYFLWLKPRTSKPLLMWVICVFSSDSVKPLSAKNSAINGLISFSSTSFEAQVTTKSSAYPIKLALAPFLSAADFIRCYSPARVTSIKVGDMIPPCGVPSSVR